MSRLDLGKGPEKLDHSYGTAANGNVLSQTLTVPTVGASTGFVAVQSYSYESLNRLKDAIENVTPNGGSASQCGSRRSLTIGTVIGISIRRYDTACFVRKSKRYESVDKHRR